MAVKVGISGSYGGFNLGDEAILHCIVAGLRATLPVEITVFSRDAQDTRQRHRVEHVVQKRDLSRAETRELLAGLSLFILGGGGLLYDGDAETYLREVVLAREVGTPVLIYAIGAGPLLSGRLRSCVRDALNLANRISVRDRHSRRLLEEIGVTQELTLTADPALLLEPEPLSLDEILRTEGITSDARLIGFSVREPGPAAPNLSVEHYHRLLANAADFMINRLEAEVVFVPMERRAFDVQHSHGVLGQMNHAHHAMVLRRDYTPGQLLFLLTHFEFNVGMRLHFLIFSALAGVPFIGLPYGTKVAGFLEEMQLHVPVLEHVSAGQLIADIDRAWDQRHDLRRRIQESLPELQRRARWNNTLALELVDSAGTANLRRG